MDQLSVQLMENKVTVLVSVAAAFLTYTYTKKETVKSKSSRTSVDVLGKLKKDHMNDEVPPLESMLRSAQLVYNYGDLRDLVRFNDASMNKDLPSCDKKKRELVDFVSPELIVTQEGADGKHLKSCYLKYPISHPAILTFVQKNRHLIGLDDEGYYKITSENAKIDPETLPPLPIEAKLQDMIDKHDSEIIEFDDEYDSSELLFSIILNKSEKRITCVFRGSVTGGADWSTNAKMFRTNPDVLATFAGKNLGIHRGFANYLFNADWTKEGEPSKFDQIVDIIMELREKEDANGKPLYKDYEIFVTGHSLGGALTQLLSFAIAGHSRTKELPSPITAITFASPQVGSGNWVDAYQKLEKEGRLRHLRIFNTGDVVAVNPSIPFLGYSQTGIGIHLKPDGKKAEVGYRNAKSPWSALSLYNPGTMHGLDSHYERLFNSANANLLKKGVEELYDEHAGDFTD